MRMPLINCKEKNVSMKLTMTKTTSNSTQTVEISFKINGLAETTTQWNTEDSDKIESWSDQVTQYILGQATFFKKKTSDISIQTLENINQQPNSSTQSVQIGDSTLSLNFSYDYGVWRAERIKDQVDDNHNREYHVGKIDFSFRPNSNEVRKAFNSNTIVITTFAINVHQGSITSPIVATSLVTLTINPAARRPTISIVSDSSNIIEGGSATFTLNSDIEPKQNLNVLYTASNNLGNYLDPLTHSSNISRVANLNFQKAQDSDNWTDELSLKLRDADGLDAEDGQIVLTLNPTDVYTPYVVAKTPQNSATLVVEDAEKPALSFTENSITIVEEDVDKNVQLTLNLSEVIEDEVAVSYIIVEETATSGVDYIDVANGLVSISANTTSIPINIRIKGDDLSEGDETFKVLVTTPPSNAYLFHGVPKLEATVTIYDDEPILLSATTDDFYVAEDMINGNVSIDLELTSAVEDTNSATTQISYETAVSNGTATKDEDFLDPTSNTTVIATSAVTSSITVPIINDAKNEGNETFNVIISNLNGANFADGGTELNLNVTIIDNEKPILSFAQNSYSVDEEDIDTNVVLTFNLSGPIENPVDIAYETVEETAIADEDFTSISDGIVTIANNSTSAEISIQIKGDVVNEGTETFKVRVAIPPSNAVFKR